MYCTINFLQFNKLLLLQFLATFWIKKKVIAENCDLNSSSVNCSLQNCKVDFRLGNSTKIFKAVCGVHLLPQTGTQHNLRAHVDYHFDFFPVSSFEFSDKCKDDKIINGRTLSTYKQEECIFGDISNETMDLCLRLSNIFVVKRNFRPGRNNDTVIYYSDEYRFLMNVIKYFSLDIEFNSTKYVGIISLNKTCLIKLSNTSCILKVEVTKEILSLNVSSSVMSNYDFGERQLWITELNGTVRHLTIETSGNFYDIIKKPLLFLCQMNIRQLSLSGFWLGNSTFELPNLPNLWRFTLSHNNIGKIGEGIFNKVKNIRNLELLNNDVKYPVTGINNLKKLNVFKFSGFIEYSIHEKEYLIKELHQLDKLKNLSLSKINLKQNFGQLLPRNNKTLLWEVLELINCHIRDIHEYTFVNLPCLIHLDLTGNHIVELPPGTFKHLRNLKTLTLSYNDIYRAPSLELHPCVKAEEITFSHNNISLFPVITGGVTKKYDISYNKIYEWNRTDIFISLQKTTKRGRNKTHHLPWVENLDISYNSIHYITPVMLNTFHDLKSLEIGGNQIDCLNCNIPPLKKWLLMVYNGTFKNFTLYNLGSTVRRLRCSLPAKLKGRTITDQLHFDMTPCLPILVNYMLVIGVPVSCVVFVITLISSLAYIYRFEITYLINYFKLKRRKKYNRNADQGKYDYDIFVCYSKNERWWVLDHLLPNLEKEPEKYAVCLHERDFPLGSYILENIESAMRLSRFTLVVLSNSFVKSQWCRWELEMANYKMFEDDREFLILVELERIQLGSLPRHLKYLIDTRTYLEWSEKGDTQVESQQILWKRLKRALGESIHQKCMKQKIVNDYASDTNIEVDENTPLLQNLTGI